MTHSHQKTQTHQAIIILLAALFISAASLLARNFATTFTIHAETSVEDLQKQIEELQRLKEMSEAATAPLEKEVTNIQNRVNGIKRDLVAADAETQHLEGSIETRSLQLDAQYAYLAARVRSYYKLSRQYSPITTFLAAPSAAGLTRQLTYRTTAVDQDKSIITKTTQELIQLEEDKKALEARKAKLALLRSQFEGQASFFTGEIAKARDYQQNLAGQIADLSKRQQEILAAKTGTFQTTVGDVPPADDPASRPDYNPGFSPAFALFSFGAPHFKGMSQYGAYGRAKAGQSAEDILKAYYGGGIEIKKDYDTNIQINVDGYGSYSLEDYAKRIYEVPNGWGDNGGMAALRAQAVAARSYALARTNNGSGSICATEACQVFKPDPKGGNWEKAVDDTRGWVLVANGQPFSAWYASTSGGYQLSYSSQGHTTPGLWDTPSGRSGWTSEAYEKQAGSPWFYKAWYKDRSGDSCGRSHPWLNGEEMADILNAWVVLIKAGISDDRITPSGSCWGGNPYSIGELRDKANQNGGGYSKVTGASVTYADNGITANIRLDTDKGSVTISGADFKKAFNLRAPGKISLKSNLYNIEKK
jgi:peptidoglycan hydrolase-like amidase